MLKNVGPKVYICSEWSNLLLQRLLNGTIRTINKVSMFYLFIRLYLCLSVYFLLITLSVGRHSTLTTALYIFLFVYQTLSGGLSFSLALCSPDYLFFFFACFFLNIPVLLCLLVCLFLCFFVLIFLCFSVCMSVYFFVFLSFINACLSLSFCFLANFCLLLCMSV
jgi:hypothetical protein